MSGCLLPTQPGSMELLPYFHASSASLAFQTLGVPAPHALRQKRPTWLVTTPHGQCPHHRACDSLPLLSTLHLTPTTAHSPQVQAAVLPAALIPPWCLVLVLLGPQHHLYAEWTSSAPPTPHRCQRSARPVHNSGPFTGPVLLLMSLISECPLRISGGHLCAPSSVNHPYLCWCEPTRGNPTFRISQPKISSQSSSFNTLGLALIIYDQTTELF